ncbi:LysR family transcriptional regulator [Pseudoalteromonas issachenkonii]|uniref:LysR family transcriptional regulator n=1 Tax=Pseudoalteromonas issachenkonii TaxID=152297 RepID=A0ABU9GWE4_9GAMM
MDTIIGIKTIIAVVETGSFTAAGDRLGLSKALVSKYVGIVEQDLGVRLFNRSTRRISITEAGQSYYTSVVPVIESYSEMLDNLSGQTALASGKLRVSAPVSFGESNLAPLMPELLNRYPDLSIDLVLSDKTIDLLEEGVDLAIRIGSVSDSNLIARQITSYPLILCASAEYIQRFGAPASVNELEQHATVIDSNFKIGRHWPLVSPSGEALTANVNSRVSVNNPQAVKEVVVAGGGIGLIPEIVVRDDIASGNLVQVMADYKTFEFGLFAIYPHRKFVAQKVTSFIQFLFENFEARPKTKTKTKT